MKSFGTWLIQELEAREWSIDELCQRCDVSRDTILRVAGGARSNVFIVKDGKVFTPPLSSGALEGITRKVVINVCKDLGVECSEEELSVDDVLNSDEAFLTSALLEVMPLVELDGNSISSGKPGDITKQIHKKYKELV